MRPETIMLVCLVCGHRSLTERRLGADICGVCGASGQMSTLYLPPTLENRAGDSIPALLKRRVSIDQRRS